jgi:hypothetical protein
MTNTLDEIAPMIVEFGIYFLPVLFFEVFFRSPVKHYFITRGNRRFLALCVLTPSQLLEFYNVDRSVVFISTEKCKYMNAQTQRKWIKINISD